MKSFLLPLLLLISQEPTEPAEPADKRIERTSSGCLSCHKGIEDAHDPERVSIRIGCTEGHGGNATSGAPAGAAKGSAAYEKAKRAAHVLPRDAKVWKSSANPVRSYAALNREPKEFVRFVNPGDLRVASE